MHKWRAAGVEPSLDELLGDDVMVPVMRSAGLCADDIRALVVETAERVCEQHENSSGRRSIDG